MKVTGNFISVDPGSQGTGIAYFSLSDEPLAIKNLDSIHKEWIMKCNEICYKFQATLLMYKPNEVFCEQPAFFESFIGVTSAKKQDLIKLTILFGRFWQISTDLQIEFIPIKIIDWKGQMNKLQTANRVHHLIGQKYKTTHETDAVGIGLFIKGLF